VVDAVAKRPAKPASLYPLPASKVEVEKEEAQAVEHGVRFQGGEQPDFEGTLTPAKAIAQNGFIRATQQLLMRGYGDSED